MVTFYYEDGIEYTEVLFKYHKYLASFDGRVIPLIKTEGVKNDR